MAIDANKWLSAAEFITRQTTHVARKAINVDHDRPGNNRTCGMLYDAEMHADAINAAPALRCPSCGEPAAGIAGASQLYQISVAEGGGKSHKANVPPCPVGGLEHPLMVYSVEPCGCRVNAEWAGAFTAELNSRISGNAPKAVNGLSEKAKAKRLTFLEEKLSALYCLQNELDAVVLPGPDGTQWLPFTDTATTKEAVDYWIVIVADQIQRLCPGAHNTTPTPKPLCAQVTDWVNREGFTPPPSVPMVFESQFLGGYPANLVQTVGVPPAVVQGDPDKLQIRKTKAGQWSVLYGDVYKVFTTPKEADEFAAKLIAADSAGKQAPMIKAGSKPLQTLPVGGTKLDWDDLAGAPTIETPSNTSQLVQALLKLPARHFPMALLKTVLDATYANAPFAVNVINATFGNNLEWEMFGDTATAKLGAIRKSLGNYIDSGRQTALSADAFKFVKAFLETSDMEFDMPEVPAAVVPSVVPPPSPPPATDKTARKKRTIRRIQD